MRNDVALLAGVAIGAGTMFLMDPARRRRRRAPDASKLGERVRAELERVVSHPDAVDVSVPHDGCVCLSGQILSGEADAALAVVAGVGGVSNVEDNLERHDSPEGVPALQGAWLRTVPPAGALQNSWSPARKLMVALTGTAVAAGVTYAMRTTSTSGSSGEKAA